MSDQEKTPQGNVHKLLIDGETVEVPDDIVVGYVDILKADAEKMAEHPGLTEAISNSDPTSFHPYVLQSLRSEAQSHLDQGEDPKETYKAMATHYHPDLYRSADEDVQITADHFFKGLNALRDAGKLQNEMIVITEDDTKEPDIVINGDDL
jgi:hypothetical protein